MSCMLCDECGALVDTDFDPDSLYVDGRNCLCSGCRDELDEPSEFQKDGPDAFECSMREIERIGKANPVAVFPDNGRRPVQSDEPYSMADKLREQRSNGERH